MDANNSNNYYSFKLLLYFAAILLLYEVLLLYNIYTVCIASPVHRHMYILTCM